MSEKEILKLFNSEKSKFLEYFDIDDVVFIIHNREFTPECNSYRDVAWADPLLRTVNVCRRVLEFSTENITALIRHEISHLCDPFYDTNKAEQRADDIAFLVTGQRINYSGPCLIQTIGPGEHPRPKILHSWVKNDLCSYKK